MKDADPSRQWVHDLCDAVSSISLSVAVAQRLLADGDQVRALDFLKQAEESCERCRQLAVSPPS